MMNILLRKIVCSLALLALVAPSTALAYTASGPTSKYDVTLTPVIGDRYPISANIQLHVGSDNVVSGYYSTQDDPMPRPITGGRDGDKLWFEVGTSGGLQVQARLRNGKLSGTAFDGRNVEYDFSAVRD